MLQREQLQDHETRIVWLEKEYEELLSKTPEKNSKSRFAQECVEKEAHLLNEVRLFFNIIYLSKNINLKNLIFTYISEFYCKNTNLTIIIMI